MEVDINWFAVIAGTVANMVIGALWYSLLFAKRWTAEVEKTIGKETFKRLHDAMQSKSVAFRTYGLTAVGAFLVSYVMGLIADWRAADTIVEGLMIGGVTGLCFVVTTALVMVLFEGRSRIVYFVSMAPQLVAVVATGVILAVWQ